MPQISKCFIQMYGVVLSTFQARQFHSYVFGRLLQTYALLPYSAGNGALQNVNILHVTLIC